MKTRNKMAAVAFAASVIATLGNAPVASAQTCQTQRINYNESFDDTVYRDDSTSAAGWGTTGTLKLALKGNSFNTSSGNTSEKIFVVGAADFDGDGWIDMAAVMLSPDRLHFLKNMGINADGSHKGFSTGGAKNSTGWNNQIIDGAIPDFDANAPALFAGDFDGDGDSDLLYMKTNVQDNAGSVIRAFVWRLDNVVAGIPKFTRLEFTSHFQANRVSWHWTSTFAQLVDWNKDGRMDLVTNSSYGSVNKVLLFKSKSNGGIGFEAPVELLSNVGFTPPFADAGTLNTATGGATCVPPNLLGTFKSRGGTGLAVADFDGDGDLDIISGSMSEKNLKFWKNDGADVFTQQPDITFSFGGTTFIVNGDLDGDGDIDIVVGRDGYNCGGNGGNAYFFANSGNGAFTMRSAPILNTGVDIDFGAAFYIDENIKYPNLNKYAEKTVDIIAADGNDSGQYSQVLGSRLNVYNLEGIANSKVIDALDNTTNAIVEVQMTAVDQLRSPPATDVTYYVSNDGGANWERLLPNEVANGSVAGDVHTFSHFGSDFQYRIVLSSQAQTLTGNEAPFAPGSKVTPEVRSVTFSYGYVLRREYSRSALAYASQMPVGGGETKDLVISSTFFYPGFEGTLRAFRADRPLATTTEPNNELNQKVVKTGIGNALVWDAAELLRLMPGTSRSIYTALPGSNGVVNQRLGFTTGNAATLASHMATDTATATSVISFVRNGMGHLLGTKLWDVGHSSPVYLGPPVENGSDKSLTEDGYATFAAANQNRQRTVFLGTNDGMVHAFNAVTGVEMWAFVPYNLLAKLKLQRETDADGNAYFNHQSLVDGSVVVRDVFDRGAGRWRTMLITGQALGTGRADNNYYFGLDVTDPTNPVPMWEFTDDWAALDKSCTGQFSRTTCVTTPQNPTCLCGSAGPASCGGACALPNHVFIDAGANQVAIEAENFNSMSSLTSNDKHTFVTRSTVTGYTGTGYIEATPDDNTNCNNNYTTCGATTTYQFQADSSGSYRAYIRYRAPNNNSSGFRIRIGSLLNQQILNSALTNNGTWQWIYTNAFNLTVSDYDLELFMIRSGFQIDRIIISKASTTSTSLAQTCLNSCTPNDPITTCTTENFDPASESFECGAGTNLKCCQDPSTQWYCSPVGQACEDLDTVLGQTWSPPVVAPLKVNGSRSWNVVFGSGYSNRAGVPAAVGRSVYAIDAVTGVMRGKWNYNDIAYNASSNPSTIDNTIPGGVTVYDWTTSGTDETPDGYADAIYFGDLEGRLWKIDVHDSGAPSGSTGTVPLNQWPTCVLFDAGTPNGGSTRRWAPIITTPAVSLVKADDIPPGFSARRPVVYFGTGGDDRAPQNPGPGVSDMYRFYAVRDTRECAASTTPVTTGAKTSVDIFNTTNNPKRTEWIVGDNLDLNGTALSGPFVGSEGAIGQRYWSDPVISDESVVYFASLGGSIESVNPCNNLSDSSLLYGYAIRDFSDGNGVRYTAGKSTFLDAANASKAFLRSASKIRRSILVQQQAPTAGVAQPPSGTPVAATAENNKVFVQTFDGEIRAFEKPVVSETNTIRVLRWREIPIK